MKPENQAFLEDNRHHWHTLRDAQFCRHLDGNTRESMRRVMAEEFRPGYSADLWCPPCVAEMIKQLYFEFEKWESNQIKVPEVTQPVLPAAPEQDLPVPVEEMTKGPKPISPVKASFPSSKNPTRK